MKFLRLYIDVPTIFGALLIISLFYRPLAEVLFGSMSDWSKEWNQEWIDDLVIGCLASLLASVAIVLSVFFIFRINEKSALAGTYKAYINGEKKDDWIEWGTVKIQYNFFTRQYRIVIIYDDVVLVGRGELAMSRHLMGTYVETGNLLRRRFGTFLYTLDGEAQTLQGIYTFFDPANDSLDIPAFNEAKWVKNAS